MFKPKRAITVEENAAIIAREGNPELHAFCQLCWFLGGAQSDVATLFDMSEATANRYFTRLKEKERICHSGGLYWVANKEVTPA